MGSPHTLNLRNLAWHGFINPGELDQRGYSSVLLFTCAVIGRQLAKCGIEAQDIVPRRWTKLPELSDSFPWSEGDFIEAVSSTERLPDKRRPILRRALDHHHCGYYGRCCTLILPELEHLLRLIFCAVNNCPTRILTAESVVHYTTLDVILEQKETSVVPFLGGALHAALVDLLAEPSGPRIRDRFSHGECRLADADATTSRLLLSIVLFLLTDQHPPDYVPVFSRSALFHRQLLASLQVRYPEPAYISRFASSSLTFTFHA